MKKSPWLRSYRDALHNPKIIRLSDRLFRVWQCCLWVADDAGVLPSIPDLACHLRMSVVDAEQLICELIETKLVDVSSPGTCVRTLTMHDWNTHQFIEKSTERVRKFRSKNKHVTVKQDETFQKRDETPPYQTHITDTDTKKLLPSNPEPARAKEHDFIFGLKKVERKRSDDIETIVKRAEGLGLDVDELIETTNRNKPKNRSAYFTTLCVNKLAGTLPGLSEKLIREALWGNTEQYSAINQLLVRGDV